MHCPVLVNNFKDHFSGHAADYSAYRPTYPPKLFAWLSQQAQSRELAWDCATGNGQAALLLAQFFQRVLATDASSAQINHARLHSNVEYRVEAAERSSLDNHCVDLVLVAQAYHWFDHEAFLAEVGRVVKPGGLLSLVSYRLATVNEAVDEIVSDLWGQILTGWWPQERTLVDEGLHALELPFEEVTAPPFEMSAQWRLEALLNYLGTWSSVKKYTTAVGVNPLTGVSHALARAWGDPDQLLKVTWPLDLRVVRI